MTEAAVVYTTMRESAGAGAALGWQICEKLEKAPDVVLVFVSPVYDHEEVLKALERTCYPKIMLGCSSAGEFAGQFQGRGMACAVALTSDEMRFSLGVGRCLAEDTRKAAAEVVSTFHGVEEAGRQRSISRFDTLFDDLEVNNNLKEYRYRSAIILLDGLFARSEQFLEDLSVLTYGRYQFFGGGAGDNAQFVRTVVFNGTEVLINAVVALEILSDKPLGIGTLHCWTPVTEPMVATEINGRDLISIDHRPAVEIFREHASRSGQYFDVQQPRSFLINNLIGIDTSAGYKLRLPLQINQDGSITCATAIPENAKIQLMHSTVASTLDAAEMAAKTALQRLYGGKPAVTLFFDCAASRLRLGDAFLQELQAIQRVGDTCHLVGCNSHGQIVRTEGQYHGFMNCTPSVCMIPG